MDMERTTSFDPRTTTLSFAVTMAVVAFGHLSLPAIGAVAMVLTVLLGLGQGGRRRLFAAVTRIVPLAAIIIAINGVAVRGEPGLSVDGHTVLSRAGLVSGTYFALRAVAMLTAIALLLVQTPPAGFARVAHAVIRPFSARAADNVAFHAFIAMSFVPLFVDEFARIRVAQGFRGGTLSGGVLARASNARLVLVPLVLAAIHRSEQLAAVVELRGIRERVGARRGLSGVSAADVGLVVVTVAGLAAAMMLSGLEG